MRLLTRFSMLHLMSKIVHALFGDAADAGETLTLFLFDIVRKIYPQPS